MSISEFVEHNYCKEFKCNGFYSQAKKQLKTDNWTCTNALAAALASKEKGYDCADYFRSITGHQPGLERFFFRNDKFTEDFTVKNEGDGLVESFVFKGNEQGIILERHFNKNGIYKTVVTFV